MGQWPKWPHRLLWQWLYTLLWYESLCTFLGLELVSWHLYVRLGVPGHVGEISFKFCVVASWPVYLGAWPGGSWLPWWAVTCFSIFFGRVHPSGKTRVECQKLRFFAILVCPNLSWDLSWRFVLLHAAVFRRGQKWAPSENIFALLWDERQLDVWDDRQRAGNSEPLHSWATVVTVKANEHAMAAILADGSVMAYGEQCGGGTLADLVAQSTCKWPAVELYTARYAFLVTLSNGTAIIWGSLRENGPLPTWPVVVEKPGCKAANVKSTSYAFG